MKCGRKNILIGISGILVWFFLAPMQLVWAEVPAEFIEEAKTLAKAEKEYFQHRLDNDWEALYAFQHPIYKERISLEELIYFEGRLSYNYRKAGEVHMSGLMTPSLSFIKTRPPKRDALGFPIPRQYKWYTNVFLTVKDYIQDTISISRDRTHAVVNVFLKGKEKLNPAIFRDQFEFDFKKLQKDFWEKVDGKWVITVLANSVDVSGTRVPYLIPNNNDAWQKMEFVDINPALIGIKNKEK